MSSTASKQESEVVASIDSAQTPPALTPSVKKGTGFFYLLMIALLVTVSVNTVYFWRELQATHIELTEFGAQIKDQRNQFVQTHQTLEGRIQQVNSQTDTSTTQLANIQLRLDQLDKSVGAHQQQLNELSANAREDWLLAEAEYLLKIASQKLMLESDAVNARILLASADQRVRQAASLTGESNANLFTLRNILSNHLLTLEQFTPVDKQGIYVRLSALADTIDNLPRTPGSSFSQDPAPESATPRQTNSAWLDRFWHEFTSVLGKLEDYIRIDSAKMPARPLVDANIIQLANMNLRLLLEQAQLSVMKADAALYQRSLSQAQKLLGDYYAESPQVDQMRRQLSELHQLNIAPKLPDINEAVEAIQQLIKRQQNNQTSVSE
jgi:uroporphyrin-III C-methyltransferase